MGLLGPPSSGFLQRGVGAPLTTVPFSIGFWCKPVADNTTAEITLYNSALATDNRFRITVQQFGTFDALSSITAAGTADTTADANSPSTVAGDWVFVLARYISATNRRIHVLTKRDGIVSSASTTSLTPSGINSMVIHNDGMGAANGFAGINIAEFWLANADVQIDGAVIQPALMNQLAFGGPFNVMQVAKSVREYHSFRKTLLPGLGSPEDYYATGLVNWSYNSAIGPLQIADHPPLPHWYQRPSEDIAAIAVV